MPTSPSNLERRFLCPGSEAEEAKAPKQESSSAAERGTRLHNAMRELVETGVSTDIARGYLVKEDREAVEECWEWVAPFVKEPGGVVLVEERLELSFLGLNVEDDPDRCRADLIAISEDGLVAMLVDWKFGRGFTPRPAQNWQFKAYAVGVRRMYGVKTVKAHRVQPALGEQWLAFDDFDSAYLDAAEKDIVEAMRRVREEPDLIPGERQCRYCQARLTCPARNGAIMGVPRGANVIDFLRSSDPALRAETYEKILLAEEWVEELRSSIDIEIISGGLEVPGFEIGEGKGKREWQNEDGAIQVLSSLGLTQAQILPRTVISPAKAEELLGKAKRIRDAFVPVIQKTEGKPVVVRSK